METEVGPEVSPTILIHHPLARKRDSPWQSPAAEPPVGPSYANPNASWDPNGWHWNSVTFVARRREDGVVKESGENLNLKLGSGSDLAGGRPNKRVRSGSPGSAGTNYPACQVDDCRVDLSGAKDYHRRHKVCGVHSKSTQALVGKQMQRFCQQCSRFHPLPAFDEGKRSCRRRLAGHNRRRRKIQPEDGLERISHPESGKIPGAGNPEVANLVSLLTRIQGTTEVATNSPSLPDKNQLLGILSKMKSTSTRNSSTELRPSRTFDLNLPQQNQSSECVSSDNAVPSVPSTLDLLAVLSAAPKDSNPRSLTLREQFARCSDDKAHVGHPHVSHNSNIEIQPVREGNLTLQTSTEAAQSQVRDAASSLSLRLYTSTDHESPPKKYQFSDGSNFEESPSYSPLEKKSQSGQSTDDNLEHGVKSIHKDYDIVTTPKGSPASGSSPLNINKSAGQRQPHHAGSSSTSVSDHSASSSGSDARDRTDRIIFKLSNKSPNDIPGDLRMQILNWLSTCPSEMESYIKPGCVVLSMYLSMSSRSWNELQEGLLQRMHLLLECADSDFWRRGHFTVYIDQKQASYENGKFQLCKSWERLHWPEVNLVKPLAVVSGKETHLVVKGRNLTLPGTKIHCTYMGGYITKEVLSSSSTSARFDEILESFNFSGGPSVCGRFFVEVENDLKGNSFPVIVADNSICLELRQLEAELDEMTNATVPSKDKCYSRDDILHFLSELGWLFQRRTMPSILLFKDVSFARFTFLLKFAVERDWLAIVHKILDILVQRGSEGDDLIAESLGIVYESQLLCRAVNRRCRKMVDFLLHYAVNTGPESFPVYIFPPDVAGLMGITPLHLAASTEGSEDMVDALTNDPQEIGLKCWESLMDDAGQTPQAYASARNNHSYNTLVATKIADRKNYQLSISIRSLEITSEDSQVMKDPYPTGSRQLDSLTCAQCVILEKAKVRAVHFRGLLYRPFANTLLVVAAVCVCVCIFYRGAPTIRDIAPFKWRNLGSGPI